MFEVLGALSGDAKPTRCRAEDAPLLKGMDGPEFASMLQGQDDIHPAPIAPTIASGEPTETVKFDNVDVLSDGDDPQVPSSKSATDSFPILLSRGDAKPVAPEMLDAPVDHVQHWTGESESEHEARGDGVRLPSVQPEDDQGIGKSVQSDEPVIQVLDAPKARGSESAEAATPEAISPLAKSGGELGSQVREQSARAGDFIARDAAGAGQTRIQNGSAPQEPVMLDEGVGTLQKDLESAGVQEQRRATTTQEGRALPAGTVGLETAQKQQLEQQTAPASGWTTPHSKREARSAAEDTAAITIRSAQPSPQDRANTTASGNAALPQVAGAPLFVTAPRSDDPTKLRFEKEALALDAMTGEVRGSERSAGSTSVTSLAPGRAELPANVAQQLAQALRGSPKGPVEIALQPEELGRVKMTISASEAGVVVSITAERQETFDMMRRHAASLSKELAELGFGYVDLSFEQRDERSPHRPEQAHFGGPTAQGLPEGELDVLHQVAPPVAGGLDSTKALDKRI